MKKILIMLATVVALVSCDMDFYRSDTMTSAKFKADPSSAVYSTDGVYSMFKDHLDYQEGMYGSYNYSRLYFLMTELRGDNIALSGRTTDPLYEDVTYTDNPTTLDLTYMWYISYKIIYGCNSNIESLVEGQSDATDHLIGENYFLRAITHLNLCNLFAVPYTFGELKRSDMPGVVLRTSTDCSETTRATVGQVYDQIVLDLKDAIRLMSKGVRRGDAGFASYDAARGLLTRVYLYMGLNEECAALCDEMLGTAPESKLDDIKKYFPNTRTSKETLWCIAKTAEDPYYSAKSELCSMYYSPDGVGATGWLEIYWSDPLFELFSRNPSDARLHYHETVGELNDGKVMLHWPVIDPANRFRNNTNVMNVVGFDLNADENKIMWQGKEYTVKRKMINKAPVFYIQGIYSDQEDNDGFEGGTKVYVKNNVDLTLGIRQTFPVSMMTKFSDPEGVEKMLASPAMIRWAEVILNRAEANAKLGNGDLALNDVNVLRKRAGLTGEALFTTTNYGEWGYDNILDVVLDERRLELCFEGHRAIDLYRNGKTIDRRFAGVHDWEELDQTALDFRFPYCIPFAETSVSGISGNGKNY